MSYSVLHVVHLLAAIFFIGTLFFEVMILGRIRQQIGEQTMPLVERAVGARSRVVLHWVVLFVYAPVSAWPGITARHWPIRSPAASPHN